MNSIGFLTMPLIEHECKLIYPLIWDHQTLVILSHTVELNAIKSNIRSMHKPTSHSCGDGYEIDVYTNLNYDRNETDPAMRNIRCVYCDAYIMDMESVNKRFPNAYIYVINEKKGDRNDARRISREILEISRN